MNFFLTQAGSQRSQILGRWRRLLSLLWLYVGTALHGHGQELVINGGFAQGNPVGWTMTGGWIGFVSSPGSDTGGVGSWIGVGGVAEQVLTTEPGQTYVLTFSRQGYDSSQPPRATAMEVHWDGRRIQRFDFAAGDTAWRRPRFHLRATGTRTPLTFLGFGSPSLDNVSVVPRTNDLLIGSVRIVETGTAPVENGELVLETAWEDFNGPVTVGQQQVQLGGTRSIGIIPSLTNRFRWTNLPAGTHHLSAEFAGVRSADVRVVVPTRPKVRITSPVDRTVAEPGATLRIAAGTVDNDGRIRRVRFSADDEVLSLVDAGASDQTVSADWTVGPEGFHRIRVEGLAADGGVLDEAGITVQSLPSAVRAQSQEEWSGSIFFTSATPAAQVFRLRRGGRLHSVELDLSHNDGADLGPVTVSLHTVENGLPTTNRLASVTVPLHQAYVAPQSSARARFHFPSPPDVVAGPNYAVVVETTGTIGTTLRSSSRNSYPAGHVASRISGTWTRHPSTESSDLIFVAWVIPGAEPRLTLLQPEDGASLPANLPFRFASRLEAGSDGTVVYTVDGTPATDPVTSPFAGDWTSPQPGVHVVQATWTSDRGQVVRSDPVRVQVGDPEGPQPRLSVAPARSPEGDTSLPPVVFRLSLDRPSESPVQVDYSTQDGTALADQDYIANSGMVRFAPGQTEAYVFVRILPDIFPNGNRRFRVVLSPPVGALLGNAWAYGTILEDDGGAEIAARFGVEFEPGPGTLGADRNVTLRTLRQDGSVQSDMDRSAVLRLATTRSVTRTILEEPYTMDGLVGGGVQTGYRFRTTAPLLVSQVRAAARGRVTVWTEDGRRLASAELPATTNGWAEVRFDPPAFIEAGSAFRVSILTVDGSLPFSSRFPNTPGVIVESAACFSSGDSFPANLSFNGFPRLDLAFSVLHWVGDAPPRRVEIGAGGPWNGTVRLDAVGNPVHLVATDPDRILTPAVASIPVPPPSPIRFGIRRTEDRVQFLVEGPPGRLVRIQASNLDGLWTDLSPSLRLGDSPTQWPDSPFPGDGELRFHRVLLLE